MARNKHIGSSFDDYLKKDGSFDKVDAVAIKRVLSYQINEALREAHMSKAEFARRMKTSRSSLDRLLDPNNQSLTFGTATKAASVLGKKLKVELV